MHSIKRHTMYNQYKNKMTKCFSLGRKASRVFWIPLSLANSCLTERARWQSLRRAHIKRNVNAKRKLQAASSNLLSADLLPREWRTIWAWPFLAGAANIHASDPKGKSQRQRLARYLELPCSHKAFRANKKGSQDEKHKDWPASGSCGPHQTSSHPGLPSMRGIKSSLPRNLFYLGVHE